MPGSRHSSRWWQRWLPLRQTGKEWQWFWLQEGGTSQQEGQNVILVVDRRSLTLGPTALRRNLPRRLPRKCNSPRRQSRQTPIAVSLKTCVGSSARQPTKEEVEKCRCQHADKWVSDLPSMQSYRQWKGIILDNLPPHDYKDHSDYIRQVLCNNESAGLSIYHISDLLKHYSKDSSSTRKKRYDALKMLSGVTMGKSGASPLFVMEVFKAPMMKEISMPDNVNGYYSQVMTGTCQPFCPWCNLQDHHEWHREQEKDAQWMLLPFVHLPGQQPHDHEQSHGRSFRSSNGEGLRCGWDWVVPWASLQCDLQYRVISQ